MKIVLSFLICITCLFQTSLTARWPEGELTSEEKEKERQEREAQFRAEIKDHDLLTTYSPDCQYVTTLRTDFRNHPLYSIEWKLPHADMQVTLQERKEKPVSIRYDGEHSDYPFTLKIGIYTLYAKLNKVTTHYRSSPTRPYFSQVAEVEKALGVVSFLHGEHAAVFSFPLNQIEAWQEKDRVVTVVDAHHPELHYFYNVDKQSDAIGQFERFQQQHRAVQFWTCILYAEKQP